MQRDRETPPEFFFATTQLSPPVETGGYSMETPAELVLRRICYDLPGRALSFIEKSIVGVQFSLRELTVICCSSPTPISLLFGFHRR